MADRFAREQPHLNPLPKQRYDTSYREVRQVGWDGYIDVRGNRYSVPAALAGRRVAIRIGLDDSLRLFDGDRMVAQHRLQPVSQGWVTVADHHARLWQDALQVQQRPLTVYEAVV